LGELQPEFLDAYHAVSRLAAQVLSHNPAATLLALDAIAGNVNVATAKTKGGYE
jgi:hypothetical protein